MDRSLIGKRFAPFTFKVEAVKIREFADAIMDTNPLHRDEAFARGAHWDGLVAPLTFLFAPTLPGQVDIAEALGLDYRRALIVGIEYEYFAPVVAGELLTCETHVTDVQERSGGRAVTVTVQADLIDQRGRRVQTQWATFLQRAVASTNVEGAMPAGAGASAPDEVTNGGRGT